MIKYAGHHLAYAFTYNYPKFNASTAYVSASPMLTMACPARGAT